MYYGCIYRGNKLTDINIFLPDLQEGTIYFPRFTLSGRMCGQYFRETVVNTAVKGAAVVFCCV